MHRNISLLYLFRFFRDFLLIAPVIIPFYKSNGLSSFQVFYVQSVFSASMLIFEIPSGYLSDRYGRKITLLSGGIAIFCGFLTYSFSSGIFLFIIAEILLGFGFSLCSGTDSALLHESLSAIGKKNDYRKSESRAEFLTRAGAAVSSVSGGVIASFGIRFPFYANTATALMLPFSAFFIKETERPKESHKHILKGIISAVMFSLRHKIILSSGIISGSILAGGIISIWGFFLLLPGMNIPLKYYGILFFIYQSASAVGAKLSHGISLRLGKKKTIFLLAGIPAVYAAIGVNLFSFTAVLAFIQSFLWGISTPLFLDVINSCAKPEIRATILSTVSMGSRILYIAIGPLFGLIADNFGIYSAFIFLSATLFIFAAIAGFIYYSKPPHDIACLSRDSLKLG